VNASASDTRERLLRRIEADEAHLVDVLRAFTRIDTCNPPGDTRTGAKFLADVLETAGLASRRIAPQEMRPNLVATTAFPRPGRHLVLNGHIDVFPVGDRARWTRDPLSGDLSDGRIYGRGTVDMKCGTTASLFVYVYLSQLAHVLAGRITLVLVSDEETGGTWGSRYLVDHHASEVLGDCLLNAEPSSPHTIRFGEKGMLWARFVVRTPGGHGAYPHTSPSATKIAAHLIRDLESLETMAPSVPEKVARALAGSAVRAAIERGLGRGAAEVASRVTVNIGLLRGGVKVNMLPAECEFEVDARLPVGVERARFLEAMQRLLARYPQVTCDVRSEPGLDATWSDPEHEMMGHLQDNAEALLGVRPPAIVSLGGTDCRFWRVAGVPAYVYGCSPEGMGAPNESVAVQEFLHVVKTHALSAFDYLSR
jgi:succinyl-diaminopimelate desuccinylase